MVQAWLKMARYAAFSCHILIINQCLRLQTFYPLIRANSKKGVGAESLLGL